MDVALFLLLQAVSGPPMPLGLRKPVVRSAAPCPTQADGGEIVVCGRTPESQRLNKLPEPPSRSPQDALTFRLPGGGTGNVHAMQSNLPGATGPRGGGVAHDTFREEAPHLTPVTLNLFQGPPFHRR